MFLAHDLRSIRNGGRPCCLIPTTMLPTTSKRLKEIEWEEAIETAASECLRQRQLNNERQPESHDVYDDMGACA